MFDELPDFENDEEFDFNENMEEQTMSTGKIVGIALGAIFVLGLIAAVVLLAIDLNNVQTAEVVATATPAQNVLTVEEANEIADAIERVNQAASLVDEKADAVSVTANEQIATADGALAAKQQELEDAQKELLEAQQELARLQGQVSAATTPQPASPNTTASGTAVPGTLITGTENISGTVPHITLVGMDVKIGDDTSAGATCTKNLYGFEPYATVFTYSNDPAVAATIFDENEVTVTNHLDKREGTNPLIVAFANSIPVDFTGVVIIFIIEDDGPTLDTTTTDVAEYFDTPDKENYVIQGYNKCPDWSELRIPEIETGS